MNAIQRQESAIDNWLFFILPPRLPGESCIYLQLLAELNKSHVIIHGVINGFTVRRRNGTASFVIFFCSFSYLVQWKLLFKIFDENHHQHNDDDDDDADDGGG